MFDHTVIEAVEGSTAAEADAALIDGHQQGEGMTKHKLGFRLDRNNRGAYWLMGVLVGLAVGFVVIQHVVW